jgi:hypothetical protein
VGPKVGDLVPERLGGGRAAGSVGFESVDLTAEVGDLAAGAGVDRLEVLHAVDERLVPGDLVGRVEQLRLDLIGQDETGGESHNRHDGKTGQLLS